MTWVLLVEDDPDHRVLLREAVKRHDDAIELHAVPDYPEATRWLTERHRSEASLRDGIVLLDLGLPGPSGFALLEWAQEVGLGSLPIYVLTASENPMDADHAFNLGARGYFQKPTDFRRYVEILERILDSAGGRGDKGGEER